MERVKRNTVIAVGFSSLAVLILAAGPPVFGWTFPHALLDAACHQNPERCLSIAGSPMALCARCTGIFAGLLAGTALGLIQAPGRPLALRLLVFAASLTVVDVLAEWSGLTSNLVAVRLITGCLLGFAVALMIGNRARVDPRTSPLPVSISMQT